MKILIVGEHHQGVLSPLVAKVMGAAQALGASEVDMALFASSENTAAEAARLEGVKQVFYVDEKDMAKPLAAWVAPEIAALARGYTHVFAPGSTFGRDVLPRAAALLGLPQASEITKVADGKTFERPIYAANVIATVEMPATPVFATVRTATFKPVGTQDKAAPVERRTPGELASHSRFIELKRQESSRPDLQGASRVVSGGRGMGSKENFRLIFELADAIGAAVGASRAAVDAGYISNDLQVGQTGKIIAPDLYIAVGISGAIQHITGIKDAGMIVAINSDPEAPIFEVADVGIVGDLFEIVPQLTDALKKGG